MLKKISLPVVLAGCIAGFFLSGYVTTADPKPKYDKILHTVGMMLAREHVAPKPVDDAFSKAIFNEFLLRLDPEKDVLLQSDIDALKKYETKLDDEINGDPVAFFYEANAVYRKRIEETAVRYRQYLEKPFDFNVDESVEQDEKTIAWPANEKMRDDRLRKRVKLMTLDVYADLREQQEKSAGKEGFTPKTDAELEQQARERAGKTLDRFLERLLKKTDDDQRFSIFVNTITNTMDPHTDFFPPVEKRAFDERMSGRFFGIGALLYEADGYVKIRSVTPGGPAWKSGLVKDGDVIMKVGEGDNEALDLSGYAVEDAVKVIRGKENTIVKLTIKKADGVIQTVALQRAEIKLEETFAKSYIINGEQKLGYIYLPKFYTSFDGPGGASCSKDVAKEVMRLKAENVDGIILDIRDNGGGSLSEVVQMVGLFVKDGPVVQVKGRGGRTEVLRDYNAEVLYDGPLTVMVNEFSASASEIFAAAIQDYKRGVVVGSSSTYGKGSVQRPYPINRYSGFDNEDLGAVHITMQKYYRANGGSTQLKGVQPHIVLPGFYEAHDAREKDQPTALAWDEIGRVNYESWEKAPDIAVLGKNSARRLSQTMAFDSLRTLSVALAAENKKSRSLKWTQYKQETEEVRSIIRQMQQLTKSKTDIPLDNLNADKEALKTDEDKAARNKRWLETFRKDAYLAETVQIMADMIRMDHLVKKD